MAQGETQPLENEKRVDLTGPSVNDETLRGISGLTQLEELNLFRSQITDAGLASLRNLTRLKRLDLSHCSRITDSGLIYVAELRGLQELHLYGTPVGDAGLMHLRQLKDLRFIGLRATLVTRAGIRDLEKAIPGLTVDHFVLNPVPSGLFTLLLAAIMCAGIYLAQRTARKTKALSKGPYIVVLIPLSLKLLIFGFLLLMSAYYAGTGAIAAVATSSFSFAAALRWGQPSSLRLRLFLGALFLLADLVTFFVIMLVYDRLVFWGVPMRH